MLQDFEAACKAMEENDDFCPRAGLSYSAPSLLIESPL
jgi:hypothetical protein